MANPMGRTTGIFDGVSTEAFGVKLVNRDSGLQTDPFLPSQDFIEDDTFYRDRPYHYGTKKGQLEKTVRFFKEGFWDDELKRKFAEMIDPEHGNFVEFFTEQDPNKRWFVKYRDTVDFVNGGNQGGYFDVRFRMNSPYSYSMEYENEYDLSTGSPNTIHIANNGSIKLEPEMWIKNTGGTGFFSVKNLTTGKNFIMGEIYNDETIFVDNENGDIISDLEPSGVYRYNNHNGEYLGLNVGTNELLITGDCILTLKYRFIFKG